MKSNLIVMLTHNDKTVKEANSIFNDCADLPINFWGFKDVGIPNSQMSDLINEMKDRGKTTFLEIVSYTEAECMQGAKFAVQYGFDYLMGTLFYPSVWKYLKDQDIKYFPFVGKVYGSPSILEGSTESMIHESEFFESEGIDGVDLLAFRHKNNPESLAKEFIKGSKVPVILAGSIDSFERIEFVDQATPWAFTMGSALFDKRFDQNGGFQENLCKVIEKMKSIP